MLRTLTCLRSVVYCRWLGRRSLIRRLSRCVVLEGCTVRVPGYGGLLTAKSETNDLLASRPTPLFSAVPGESAPEIAIICSWLSASFPRFLNLATFVYWHFCDAFCFLAQFLRSGTYLFHFASLNGAKFQNALLRKLVSLATRRFTHLACCCFESRHAYSVVFRRNVVDYPAHVGLRYSSNFSREGEAAPGQSVHPRAGAYAEGHYAGTTPCI